MAYPYGPYDFGTADPQPSYQWQYPWPLEPEPCSCGRSSRHLWLTHWFRLFFMQERWP